MGLNHTMVSRLAMAFGVVAVGIRQRMPWALLVADIFGCEREVTMWGWSLLLLHYDSYRKCNTKHPVSL